MKNYVLLAASFILGTALSANAGIKEIATVNKLATNNLYGQQYGRVTLYSDAGYKGNTAVLGEGYHALKDFGGVGNDALTSLRIPYGFEVTLFSDDNFQGDQISFTSDVSGLPRNWNDKTSSILIKRVNTNSSNTSYNRGNANTRYSGYNNDRVQLFEDTDYSGSRVSLGEGDYQGSSMGIKNDALSSISVPSGYIVTLFADANFSGQRMVLTSDRSNLGDSWNDKVSSIRIARIGGNRNYNSNQYNNRKNQYNNDNEGYTNNRYNNKQSIYKDKYQRNDYNQNNTIYSQDGVSVFTDTDFKGEKSTLGIGYYRSSRMGIANDSMSSIFVPNGFKIIVYEDDNFRGSSRTYTDRVNNMGMDWNDKVSSFIIIRNR